MEKLKPTVNLVVETLIDECSIGDLPKEDHYATFDLNNRVNISDIFRYKKFKNDFASYLTCYNDGKNAIGIIRNSYAEFLSCLVKYLNIQEEEIIDDDNLTKKFYQKIEELSKIKTEQELREKFRWIWGDLIAGREYMQITRKLEKLDPRYAEECERRRHYFYSCGMRERLKAFIKVQTEVYSRFVNYREEYKEKLESKNYNGYLRKHFDLDKIAIYTAHEYLKKCEETTDKKTIEEYLNLVKNYLDSNYDKGVSIKVDRTIIDIKNIISRYEKQKKRLLPKVSHVDWIIIPNSKGEQVKQHGKARKLSMSVEKLNNLKAHGQRKEDFYESTDYVAEIIGVISNKGYIGYLYENGEIIFDREYVSCHPSTATGNAIYNLRIYDFETLSKLNKAKLKNHPKVKKIVHSKKWEEKVSEIIEREATEKEKEDVKQFIKRFQK